MQLLISCAKTMSEASVLRSGRTTEPPFGAEAERLAASLAGLTTDELARLLRINTRLAAENRQRYLSFHDAPSRPALAAYTGVVFRHIAPGAFSPEELDRAQRHLNITSFLYGLLRPLDAIRPYRLEGDVVPPDGDDRTLFARWPERLTDLLIERTQKDDGVLINLASGEMKRLFDWRRLCAAVRVITPEFRICAGDRLRTVVVYTKMCRGEMVRFILKNSLTEPEALQEFSWEGFRFDPARSRGDEWMFTAR